jgi:hypothetical protein
MAFLESTEFLMHITFGTPHPEFIRLFDALLVADIYKLPVNEIPPQTIPCEITESARFELGRLTNIVTFQQPPPNCAIRCTETGCFAPADLRSDTFICPTPGFVADLDEFVYDDGVDAAFFQIADTHLLLDTRAVHNSVLHRLPRSIHGNCVLRIMACGDNFSCGLFIGRAALSAFRPTDEFVVAAGEPLALGIDFVPGVLEDLGRWIGWHWNPNGLEADADERAPGSRPSRDERELQAAMRQIEGKKVKPVVSKRGGESSGKRGGPRGRKPKKKIEVPPGEVTLFGLLESDGPMEYLFAIVSENAREIEAMVEEMPKRKPAKVEVPKVKKVISAPLPKAAAVETVETVEVPAVVEVAPPVVVCEDTGEIVEFCAEFAAAIEEDLREIAFEPLVVADPMEAIRKLLFSENA